jgi:hypothetical protein
MGTTNTEFEFLGVNHHAVAVPADPLDFQPIADLLRLGCVPATAPIKVRASGGLQC